jgi:hypothetical protein
MDPAHLPLIKQALQRQHRKETFEHALGKVVRESGLDFGIYIKIVSEVREAAYRDGKDVEDAARGLLAEK